MTRAILLGLSLVLGGIAYADLVSYDPYRSARQQDFADAWFFAPSVASPGVILSLAALMLAFRVRRLLGRPPAAAAPVATALLFVAAAVTGLWAHLSSAPRVLGISLSALTLAASALCFGRAGLRVAWPPALLLQLAAPIPGVLVQAIMLPLQLATAELTARILSLFGFQASAIADAIYTPGRTYQVIESCSGLRGMQSLAIGAFFVYLGPLPRPPARTAALLASSVAIAVAANLARCISIVLNPASELVAVHEFQGWTMFAAGAIALALVDRLLSRRTPAAPAERPSRGERRLPLPSLRQLAWLPALLAGAAASTALPLVETPAPRIPSIHDAVTMRLGPWNSEAIKVDRRFLGSVAFSERVSRRYQIPGQPGAVDFFAGIDRREQPELSLVSPKTRIPGFGWWIEERLPTSLPGDPSAERLLLRAPNGVQWLALHWTEGTRSLWVESLRAYFALDRGPLRRSDPALVARLMTPVRGPLGEAEALLESFLPEARRALALLRPRIANSAS